MLITYVILLAWILLHVLVFILVLFLILLRILIIILIVGFLLLLIMCLLFVYVCMVQDIYRYYITDEEYWALYLNTSDASKNLGSALYCQLFSYLLLCLPLIYIELI